MCIAEKFFFKIRGQRQHAWTV